MGRMVEGRWVTDDVIANKKGQFVRQATTFRDHIEPGGEFAPEADRYHLYVSLACPWAHRTLIARALLGLEDAIGVTVVNWFMGDDGWEFTDRDGATADPIVGARYLRDIYAAARSDFTGRVTVPVLWDKQRKTIVNNESREIIRMMATTLRPLATRDRDLSPQGLRPEIDRVIEEIYTPVNNGVYMSGFARTQEAYDQAVTRLFEALDHWDEVLGARRFLCGATLTEADICLFTTLLRFDVVYATHFKCNVRRIADYPHLSGYLRDVYQTPHVAPTCDLHHIKNHYFRSHQSINPHRIVPKGPVVDLDAPHGRAKLSG